LEAKVPTLEALPNPALDEGRPGWPCCSRWWRIGREGTERPLRRPDRQRRDRRRSHLPLHRRRPDRSGANRGV